MRIAIISTDVYIYSYGVRTLSAYLKRENHDVILLSMAIPSAINENSQRKLSFKGLYSEEAIKNMVKWVGNWCQQSSCDIS